MAPSIGLNLRVTGYKHQGGRRYMEDDFGVAYQQTSDEKDLEYAFFGIFDGHGGKEAALFAKEHLMDYIVTQKGFWEEEDDAVLKAIREGFIQTHYAMWKELEKWPKTASGLPSTAGTTASIAFIRRGKIYIGHVGDSAIILGVQDPNNPDVWIADPLTVDHKPESIEESERIQQCGGKVICKSGVPRVVWNRPKMGHKGPVRRSTHIDEIPFLAVARSLGDLWSYNSEENVFVVSPEPDIHVYPVDISKHRCLILGTDGAWNMLTPQNAISVVCQAEKANEQHMLNPIEGRTTWVNPSKQLVDTAIDRWNGSRLRADNTSVVTVMLDPPGPPRAQVIKNRKRELAALNAGKDLGNPNLTGDRGSVALVTNSTAEEQNKEDESKVGCSIISRFPNSSHPVHSVGIDLVRQKKDEGDQPSTLLRDFQGCSGRISDSTLVKKTSPTPAKPASEDKVQCNEVSSSEDSPSRSLASTTIRPPTAIQPHTSMSPRLPLTPVRSIKSTPTRPASSASSSKPESSILSDPNIVPSSSSQKLKPGTSKRKSLHRELSALQLSTPRASRGLARATRSEIISIKTPEKPSTVKPRAKLVKSPVKTKSLVRQRSQELSEKIEKFEKLSAPTPTRRKTAVSLKSSVNPETPRTLRGREKSIPPTPRSGVKRKRIETVAAVLPAKSPRTAAIKPVVTRSKQATVLKLKKR